MKQDIEDTAHTSRQAQEASHVRLYQSITQIDKVSNGLIYLIEQLDKGSTPKDENKKEAVVACPPFFEVLQLSGATIHEKTERATNLIEELKSRLLQ